MIKCSVITIKLSSRQVLLMENLKVYNSRNCSFEFYLFIPMCQFGKNYVNLTPAKVGH